MIFTRPVIAFVYPYSIFNLFFSVAPLILSSMHLNLLECIFYSYDLFGLFYNLII